MWCVRDHNFLYISDQPTPTSKDLQMVTCIQVYFFQNCRPLNSLTDLPFRTNGIYTTSYKERAHQSSARLCPSRSLALPFSAAPILCKLSHQPWPPGGVWQTRRRRTALARGLTLGSGTMVQPRMTCRSTWRLLISSSSDRRRSSASCSWLHRGSCSWCKAPSTATLRRRRQARPIKVFKYIYIHI